MPQAKMQSRLGIFKQPFNSSELAGGKNVLALKECGFLITSKNNIYITTYPDISHQQVARTASLSCIKICKHHGASADFWFPEKELQNSNFGGKREVRVVSALVKITRVQCVLQ